MPEIASHKTIGILHTGEMGSALGKLLSDGGFRVIASGEGRSLRTQRLGLEAGLCFVASVREVLEHADIVFATVSPGAALELAIQVADLLGPASHKPLYIDANSISPLTVDQIKGVMSQASIDFVDATIFGLASQLSQRGALYLSGQRASEVALEFGVLLKTKVVGDSPGQASAFKMIISGIPKGLSALFIETMLFAREMDLLLEAIEASDEIYPSVMEIIRRMLPTYPTHAARRCEELAEIEKTMLDRGLAPRIIRAVHEVTSEIPRVPWGERRQHQQSIEDVIEAIYQNALRGAEDISH